MTVKLNSYRVGKILSILVKDSTNLLNRYFDTYYSQYENFFIELNSDQYDLNIELGKFKPKISSTYSVGDGKYYFGENYIYVKKENYKGAKWRFEIEGFESDSITARIQCNNLGRIFITGNVIDFLIHLLLLRNNYPLIHASAMCRNLQGIIFSSRGGGGKTSIALKLSSEDFSFLSDNYCIIHDGEVIGFPTSLNIFTYNLAPEVKDRMTNTEKVKLSFENILFRMTRGYAKFFTKVNPNRIIKDITTKCDLTQSFYLIANTGVNKDKIYFEKITREDIVNRIVQNQKLEFTFFNKYIDEYSYLFPDSRIADHWRSYKESLMNNLPPSTSCYMVTVSAKYCDQVFKRIIEVIENEFEM